MKSRIASCAALLLVLFGIAIGQEVRTLVVVKTNASGGRELSNAVPEYPQMAKIAHIEGDVALTATINEGGLIENLRAVSGHPILIQSAMDAVRQWKYEPFLLEGKPVAVETRITVSYRMPSTTASTQKNSTPEDAEKVPPPRKLRVSSGVADGNKISGEDPTYPEEAKEKKIHGDVVLQVLIDEKGNVGSLHLISGHPLLVDAATEAVKTWKYRPWLLNGEPVSVETTVTVRFHM
ncbi:MAG TPA: energy transducer TonB [Candidatus Angelobacter sp.]